MRGMKKSYVIGVDYGTDACRGVLVDTSNGKELASSVFYYPRWKQGYYCIASAAQFRQHPLDYIEGLNAVVKKVVQQVDEEVISYVVGLSVDTTGSTPCAVDKEGTPLALLPEFEHNPHAMFILWKDHTSIQEAGEINDYAKSWGGIDYATYIGSVYSSEWFWAKILRTIRVDEKVREAAYSWVEHCDWIPALLTGIKDASAIKRSRCAAGHKAMWHKSFDGLPSEAFLKGIDPLLGGLRDRLFEETYTADEVAGVITEEWAKELGLPNTVKVGCGAIDCHMGAVGGGIRPKALVKVMGTSTCDILIEDVAVMEGIVVEGICGQVDGSVIKGMIGMEAGQSAFGDVYAWYKRLLSWPLRYIPEAFREDIEDKLLYELEHEAALILPSEDNVKAIDWFNGRRTPYANQNLKGAILDINLGTDAPKIYRALIESTAYGARAIVETFRDAGVTINEVIAIGGVAKKSPLNMQIVANVLNMPIAVAEAEQAVAMGAAIFAAVVGGIYEDVEQAQIHMATRIEKTYYPQSEQVEIYNTLYKKYLEIGASIEKERSIKLK